MRETDPYIMLMTSLPSPAALFLAKQPPLSRLRLDQRLRVLTPEDRATLALVEQALNWRELPLEASEKDVVGRARHALAAIEDETLCLIVRDRFDIRTIVAALRRRHRGESAPAAGEAWGFGRWVDHIVRNWSDPAFGLSGGFAWVREADRLMKNSDVMALERLILEQAYRSLKRRKGEHFFDLVAVVIYVLEWSIVDRWGRYNAEAATRRFEELTEAGLGEYATLSFEGET